jgi:hypothetical protein
MAKSKEVTVNGESRTPATVAPISEGMLPSEFRLNPVQLMQGQSDPVKLGHAQAKDYYCATTGQSFGSDPLFVRLGMVQAWVVEKVWYEKGKKKKKWLRNEPVTPANDGREWSGVEQTADGEIEAWYDRTYWLYLLPIGVEFADDDPFAVVEPVVFRMGSTKAQVAQDLKKDLASVKAQRGIEPETVALRFGSRLVENEDNSWLSPTITKERLTTPEEQELVLQWMGIVNGIVSQRAHLLDNGGSRGSRVEEAGGEASGDEVHI